MRKIFVTILFCAVTLSVSAQRRTFQNNREESDIVEREIPEKWSKLVDGAEFIDRFAPMPRGVLSDKVWGDDNVIPRYIDNGIENDIYSFWGGNIIKDTTGLYHLFVCGWSEDNPRGHRMWGRSLLFHSVCDNSAGPFQVIDTIGFGHNVDTFQIADGSFVSYNISLARGGRTVGYYHSPTLAGEWEYHPLECNGRGRKINVTTNMSFTSRPDGSVIAVAKDGRIWISRTGLNPYYMITDYSVYPDREGFMEDPEIWRDSVQYNMLVNDAKGRLAYYGRSRNGVDWIWEDGIAYKPGALARHEDGLVEDWIKFERVKILQDEQGRAIQANFGVLDCGKELDLGNDNHSSKNIALPLYRQLLLEWSAGSEKSRCIELKICHEDGFNPENDVDVSSLRFGNYNAVSYGGGGKVIKSKVVDGDLILTFKAKDAQLSSDDFAAKLLGRKSNGELLYGYSRLPWADFDGVILSPLIPEPCSEGLAIIVENWGVVRSPRAAVVVSVDGRVIGRTEVDAIEPYKSADVIVKCAEVAADARCDIEIFCGEKRVCLSQVRM